MKAPHQILQEHLSERVANNASYSLRAFARDLEVSPQQLSNVMNGKKGLSEKMAAQLADHLGFNSQQKALFCEAARAKFARSKAQREIAKVRLAHLEEQNEDVNHLEFDLFKIISNWYHCTGRTLEDKKFKKERCGLSRCIAETSRK